MSIYRPRDAKGKLTSPFYHYDFQFQRRRFHGSTGCRKKPAAEEYERARRLEAAAEAAVLAGKAGDPMTFDLAAGRFWIERGQHYRGNAGKTFKASIAWLLAQMPEGHRLIDITNPLVADLVARRRSEDVSPATVNRTVTEPLRRIIRYAADAWDQAAPSVKWKRHTLKEPDERVRELKADEEARILAAVPEGFNDVVRFALASGCRLAECVGLTWADINWGTREISVLGKGNKRASIPLTGELRDLLFPLQAHHAERVFTYPRRRTQGLHRRGDRLPITYEGMKTTWRRAIKAAEVQNFRFHDNRHTAATRLLRAGSNLKTVQHLLRHKDIATTTKYAHVTMDDLREAMERAAKREFAETNTPAPEKSRNEPDQKVQK